MWLTNDELNFLIRVAESGKLSDIDKVYLNKMIERLNAAREVRNARTRKLVAEKRKIDKSYGRTKKVKADVENTVE